MLAFGYILSLTVSLPVLGRILLRHNFRGVKLINPTASVPSHEKARTRMRSTCTMTLAACIGCPMRCVMLSWNLQDPNTTLRGDAIGRQACQQQCYGVKGRYTGRVEQVDPHIMCSRCSSARLACSFCVASTTCRPHRIR